MKVIRILGLIQYSILISYSLKNVNSSPNIYVKLVKYNDLDPTKEPLYLINSLGLINKLKCMTLCNLNVKCIYVLFRENKCFLCNNIAMKNLISVNVKPSLSELFKKDLNDGIVPDFKFQDGLVNYWTFNSNVNDPIGGANLYDGQNAYFIHDKFNTINSALSLEQGYYKLPAGVYFDGGPFSILVWIRLKAYSNYQRILEISNGQSIDHMVLCVSLAGNLQMGYSPNNNYIVNLVVNDVLSLNTWYHVSFTFGNSYLIAYINGVYRATATATGQINNVTRTKNFIGRSNLYTTEPDARLDLDEMKIFNKALAQNEIMTEITNR